MLSFLTIQSTKKTEQTRFNEEYYENKKKKYVHENDILDDLKHWKYH